MGGGLWTEGVLVGERYRIESFLDQGAAGEVYAARNVWTDRRVALKRLQPQHLADATIVERFLLEGRIGGRIEHPNVVQTFDMGSDSSDGSLFIVQELLQGAGMREVLNSSSKMGVCDALDLMIPIMGAVYTVHQHGIVHRDIKPENIFIADGVLGHRTPKLLDFGIAKVRLQETLTQRGTVLGTLDYMAPEQLLGEHEIDRRADVWAIGVVFYELLAGVTPFETTSVGVTINRILTQDPPSIRETCPEVDRELESLLMSAMQKDRHARPDSMQEMLEALLHWVNGDGRMMERRMVARHRSSIPAILEMKLGYENGPRSSDPLRATFRGLSSEPPLSGTNPLSSTRSVSGFDLSVSQMIPVVFGDDIPDSSLEGIPDAFDPDDPVIEVGPSDRELEPAVEAATAVPEVDTSFEVEAEDPTEAFILVGGIPTGDDETTAGLPDFDLERVVRAATGEMPQAKPSVQQEDDDEDGDGDAAIKAEASEANEAGGEDDEQATLEEVREALSNDEFAKVLACAERVFEGDAAEPDRVEARLFQAEAAFWGGDFQAMERFSVDAYLLSEPGSRAWMQAIGQMSTASGTLGTHERLRDLAAVLRETPIDDSLTAEMVSVSCMLGVVIHRAGWPEHVEALLGRLTNELFDLADERAQSRAWVLLLRGELSRRCDLVRSLSLLDKAVEAFAEAGDVRRKCAHQLDVATARMRLGSLTTSAGALREAIGEAESLGIYAATPARARLADVCERLGELDEAKELALRSLGEAKTARDWHTASVALLALSSVASSEGDLKAAELHARTAVGCTAPSAAIQADALAVLSSVLRDRPLESLVASVQAMEVLQALSDSAEGEARIRLAHVMALEALDHTEPAKQALAYACERLASRASSIRDEQVRRQFLEGVREHAMTLERGRSHGVDVAQGRQSAYHPRL
jgi:serine/threonine protein kinase/tetratricopeptide (TPR) repeat protein